MKLINQAAYKFDDFLPIYNWFYPLSGKVEKTLSGNKSNGLFELIPPAISRAIYIHIPFCETICTFCPFVRGKYSNSDVIENYVQALIDEIKFKAQFQSVVTTPISAIFIGGGTPSLLLPQQLERIGKCLDDYFDLSELKEFSLEFEIKSIGAEIADAFISIGGTHARFGVQTFSDRFRAAFNLTYSLEELYDGAKLLNSKMQNVSCDMLFGMNGQTIEELEQDIENVISLGLNNVDYYPINNLMTQLKLHKFFESENLPPHSGSTKHYMNIFIRKVLEEYNYFPHNGHGYVRHDKYCDSVVSDKYSFAYHEHVYGSMHYDLIGFGNNAVSSFAGYTAQNTASRYKYMNLARENVFQHITHSHSDVIDFCRPLSLTLPYHGSVQKNVLKMKSIPEDILHRLNNLVEAEVVQETDKAFNLTREGWEWYSSVMYYLLPESERIAVDNIVLRGRRNPNRMIENNGIQMASNAISHSL